MLFFSILCGMGILGGGGMCVPLFWAGRWARDSRRDSR